MGDEHGLFHWPGVLFAALAFGGLFALVVLVGEASVEGTFRVTRHVIGFGMAAFVGYIGVAALVRRTADRG